MQKCDMNRRRRNSFNVALHFQRARTFIIFTISSGYFNFDNLLGIQQWGCFFSMVTFYIYSNLWNLEKCVQRAAFSSYFFFCRQRVGNAWKQWGKKIFKSLTKLFEPQRNFVYDGKLAHQSQNPYYIVFSLSDIHNELLVLLTATQIILW